MKVKRIRQGFLEYLVIEKEKNNDYDEKIICSNQVDTLLPCEIRSEEGKEYLYYELSSMHCLKDEIKNLKFTDFCISLIRAMEELENYLLDLDHLVLELDYIFVKNQKPKLCYCLEKETNIKEQWVDFLEEAMESISYGDRENVSKIYGFHSFLKEENPTLSQMKEYFQPEEEMDELEYEDEKEDIMEPWMEEVFVKPKKEKNKWYIALHLLVLAGLLGFISYTVAKIALQGFLYENIKNLLICISCFMIGVGSLISMKHKNKKKEKEVEKEAEMKDTEIKGDKTVLLAEETSVLVEDHIPILYSNNGLYKDIRIDKFPFLIGSDENQVDFQVEQIGVSRLHMKIEQEQEQYFIYDLNSTNGTYVNQKRVSLDGLELKAEDVIRIGLEEFRFMI